MIEVREAEVMSEAEKIEFENRVKNLTREEQEIAARHIDADIIYDEMRDRYMEMEAKVSLVEKAIGGGKDVC